MVYKAHLSIGRSVAGDILSYKEKKVYEARKLIDDVIYKLGLSSSKGNDVKTMIICITEREYGQGKWFTILIEACVYIVIRKTQLAIANHRGAT